MLDLSVFVYPQDMDCLKLDLSVEVSWSYAGEGNGSYSEKYLPGTAEVITGFMFEFLLF